MFSRLQSRSNKQNSGFSLAELLVVVAILAILAAIAIPLFLNQKKKANDSATQSDVKNLSLAVSSLMASNPTTITGSDGTLSPTITFDGVSEVKNGVSVYADAATKSWCISKQSTSGKVFAASSTKSSVFEAQNLCTSANTTPTSGTNSGGIIVSATGKLLTANQASAEISADDFWLTEDDLSALPSPKLIIYNLWGPRHGIKILKANPDSEMSLVVPKPNSRIPVQPGADYTGNISVMTRVTTNLTIQLEWYDSTGTPIPAQPGLEIRADETTPTEWVTYQITATAPEDAVTVALTFYAVWMGGEEYMFDCFGIWQGTGGKWAMPGEPIYQ